jgi:hypothetical protein
MLVTDDDYIAFVKEIWRKYPEVKYLAGSAEATPEGSPTLSSNALAYKVFEDITVDSTAIEADRTFLGLILFQAVLDNDSSKFPHLSSEKFHQLRKFTFEILEDNEQFKELVFYSLACNDLGKTQALVDIDTQTMGRKADDHDQLLAEVVAHNPTLFPGLQSLQSHIQEMYEEGLGYNFNLGQMVQGENLPYNLFTVGEIPSKSKALRLLAELYDFAGVTGHFNWKTSLVMNDSNFDLFHEAIHILLKRESQVCEQDASTVYTTYFRYRADLIGFAEHPLFYVFGRLAALSRTVTAADGELILAVWNSLSFEQQSILLSEMTVEGFNKKGILIYYFPAVIANSIKASKDFSKGLKYALEVVASVYHTTRKNLNDDHVTNQSGVHTQNVSELARFVTTVKYD